MTLIGKGQPLALSSWLCVLAFSGFAKVQEIVSRLDNTKTLISKSRSEVGATQESGTRAIFPLIEEGHDWKSKSKTLPLIDTDNTDLKKQRQSLYRGLRGSTQIGEGGRRSRCLQKL